MVSNYKRKTERGSYSKDKLREAAEAVRNGSLSGYKAAQLYNIPRMTIMDCVNKRRTKSNTLGRNTALAPEAEARLANGLKLMEKHGFGLSRKELLETVGEYVQKNNISTKFKNGIPGQAWFTGFKNRHDLSIKKPQAVEYARKKAIDPFIVFPYFDLLKNILEELNLTEKPEAIWNMDETSFSKDPEKTKIVGAKGHAATRMISSPGRDNTTVLLCGNALGEKAPPMIVYKGKNVWDSWVSPDAYPNTSYAATENGWMESEIFEQYFNKTFLPAIGNQRPTLLIFDGHATHLGLNIILKAREAGVTILKLPAHTSHVLQPLDVSLMKSFKDRWDELLVKWQRLNVGVILTKADFARLIGEVWEQIDGKILRSGFRKAGIFPYNVNEIAEKNFDSLKLQRWRQHLATTATENSATIATEQSATIATENSATIATEQSATIATENSATIATEHSATIATKNSDNKVVNNTPKSLLSLALDCITREASVASVKCDHSGQSVNTRQIQENPFFALNEDSAKNSERSAPKIQILENKIVTFEDLLLMKVQAGRNETVKRRKMAPGAEVITHEDVMKRKIEEQTKNIKKEPRTKKGKVAGKKSRDSEKENREIRNNQPGAEVITHENVDKRKIKEQTKNIEKEPQTKENDKRKVKEDKTEDLEYKVEQNSKKKKINILLERKAKEGKTQDPKEKVAKNSKKKNKQNKTIEKHRKKRKYSTSSSENEAEIKYDEESDDNDYWEQLLKESDNEDDEALISELHDADEENNNNHEPYCKDDWLLVKFCTKKSVKHYVGVVLSINDYGSPVVKYTRKKTKAEGETVFTFPVIEDISELKHTEDIVSKLPQPAIGRRGQFIFKMSFRMFNIQ